MKYLIFSLLGLALFLNFKEKPLKFGSILGTVNNVIAYSSYGKINNTNNYHNNIYTGLQWQCVEFVRRYIQITKNITFKQVNNAYEIFDLNSFNSLSGNIIPIKKYRNNSIIPPIKGALLIWKKELNITGHVAIITKVTKSYIEIAEQNWNNFSWDDNNYSRRLPVTYKDNIFSIKDNNILGWINY